MAAFRRVVIALAVLAVFAGLASAQMSCSPNTAIGQAQVRAEGKTELVGDMVFVCTGGTVNTTVGTAAPTINLTITLPQAITSKVLVPGTSAVTEALLIIDEPGTVGVAPFTGFGGAAAPTICATPATGCAAGAVAPSQFPNVNGGVPVLSLAAAALGTPTAGAPNIIQGIVSSSAPNSVTFFGVPVVPPGSQGGNRIFRITNVRSNVSAGATGNIVASLSAVNGTGNGLQQVSFTQTTATLGNVQPSLTVKATPLSTANCNALNWALAGTLSFTQSTGFTNTFRTRQVPTATIGSAQNGSTLTQTTTSALNTESGYEINAVGGTAGLADYGTRLKAIFSNIPTGARVFVSYTNVTGASAVVGLTGAASALYVNATTGGLNQIGANNNTALAELLLSGAESFPDSTTAPVATATTLTAAQVLTPNGSVAGVNTAAAPSTAATFPFFELSVSGGSATAVWEVLNTGSSFTFDVFVTTPVQGPTGTAVANLSFAPTITTPSVPQFVDPNAATPQNAITLTQCRTILLFPYLTSFAGFDTGIAVANTSTDVLGTTAQSNTCAFTLYGDPSPAPTVPAAAWSVNGGTASATISSGHVGAFALSQYAPGFTGYGIAVCNFQFAHGFAFVADWGNPNTSSAMGYLALVLPSSAPRLFGVTEGLVE